MRKRDDKNKFYKSVHEEYVLLHQTGNAKNLTRMFRTALDSYEQHYIYSLLSNPDYGVCRYIKTKDLFSVNKSVLDKDISRNTDLLSKSFNHYRYVPKGLDLSYGGKFGYVYVLTNECMPNLIKIGYTCITAFDRAKQLSTTSVAYSFKVDYLARVRKPVEVEKLVHHQLQAFRVNSDREFFETSVENAIFVIESIAMYIPKQNLSVKPDS
ncbi:GIY-YIG nuclease family protein [Cobetia amphilecti]|uniref:GIY-YIG nuclease family protein n=2 Tax=Cobetia amphilecti TaxID=1055104 RepID=A0ABT6USE9_9GAMM|nr:GIY-YIG nuclease family protein [Cobetia amphilecti]MDI5885635.1 GIY-YIG nuclease family protein [Cobetia amphilecti]